MPYLKIISFSDYLPSSGGLLGDRGGITRKAAPHVGKKSDRESDFMRRLPRGKKSVSKFCFRTFWPQVIQHK